MHIALDISSAARKESTGVAVYIRRILGGLAQAGAGHQFTLVTRASRWKNLLRRPPLPAPNFRHKLFLERMHPFFARSLDVFHGLDARLPGPWLKVPTVVTVHDIFSALQSEDFATRDFRDMKAQRYRDLAARADRIICVSDCTRRDVLEILRPDPARVRVVHEAGSAEFVARPRSEVDAARKRFGLDKPYFLFVGSLNKRKNVPAQVRAFALARERTRADVVLAIAGRVGFGGEEIRAAIAQLGDERVRMLGYVENDLLAPLYTGARGLLFATLYEGFGIPALEAAACGCPVIGSTVGALPETLGDAGLLADPASIESIAAQIEKLITDNSLHASLVEKGLRRAAQFSWEKAARECLAIYAELKR